MNAYEYQVLRFLPDRVSGEFVNVGLVLYQPQTGFLRAGFLRSVSRVTAFFPGVDGRYLQRRLRHLEGMLGGFASQLTQVIHPEPPASVAVLTSRYLTRDDTSIQFTDVERGLDDDLERAFDELHDRLVENYVAPASEEIRNDYDVWQKLYRPLFERQGITSRLKAHQVVTANDTLDFSYAWKNEVWHCYEPVSFNLKKSDSVKNKVYRWIGKLDELKTAEEALQIELLTVLPNDDPELMAFILEKLDKKVFGATTVSVVGQQEAEQFVRHVQEELIEHAEN